MVILHIKDYGDIKISLDYNNAPITCKNFVYLVSQGFYDGLTFHRIIRNFMIQGGDPNGNGTGGPGFSIKGEFSLNGVKNHLKHHRGTVSMARAMGMDTAGSQFFICDNDDYFLDGQYAAFGTVIDGMDVVDKIALVNKDEDDKPLKLIVITKAEVIDEKIEDYPKIK